MDKSSNEHKMPKGGLEPPRAVAHCTLNAAPPLGRKSPLPVQPSRRRSERAERATDYDSSYDSLRPCRRCWRLLPGAAFNRPRGTPTAHPPPAGRGGGGC